MLFWIISVTLAAALTVLLALPLLRQPRQPQGDAPDVALYKDQLTGVDRDLARGVLDLAEADRTRTEIARRLLSADKSGPAALRDAPRAATLIATALAGLLLIAGGVALYDRLGAPGYPDVPLGARIAAGDAIRASRMTQAEAEELALAAAPPPATAEASLDYIAMVDQLREVVPTRPDDLQGWELLARHEAALGNFAAAARAQDRVITLRGFDVTVADYVALTDRLVAAAQGFVSPETEEVLRRILIVEPDNTAARYYTGLLYAQTDRPDVAFRLWRALVEAGNPADPHVGLAGLQIADAAFYAGVDYEPPPRPGPSAADMAAAQDMTPEDRTAMIRGMVDGLSDRLATAGGPPQDWAQLIVALSVLGDMEQASAIWTEAQTVFAADPAAMTILRDAGAQAGLPQ